MRSFGLRQWLCVPSKRVSSFCRGKKAKKAIGDGAMGSLTVYLFSNDRVIFHGVVRAVLCVPVSLMDGTGQSLSRLDAVVLLLLLMAVVFFFCLSAFCQQLSTGLPFRRSTMFTLRTLV